MSNGDIPADVTPAEAARLTDAGAVLLDVREDHEWAEGHAPQAVHLPMTRLGARYEELPMDRTLVCVCHVGARSAAVAAALARLGYDTVNVAGGMNAWEAAGLPVVHD